MEATSRSLRTAEWVAQRMGLRLHRVYELARTGQIPAVHIGRQLRFDPEALEEWIREGGTGGPDAAA